MAHQSFRGGFCAIQHEFPGGHAVVGGHASGFRAESSRSWGRRAGRQHYRLDEDFRCGTGARGGYRREMLWLITFAGSTVVGIPLLIHEGMSVGELRKLARAEAEAEEVGTHIAVSLANGGDYKFERGRAPGEPSRR